MPSHNDILNALKEGHARFLSGHSIHPHANQAHLEELESGQHPEVAILSCSDSRVPVELLFDSGFGDMFVVRNAGNACTPGSIASLEYGVKALKVKLVLVLGHEQCGAVTTACSPLHDLTPSLLELVGDIREALQDEGLTGDVNRAFHVHPKITARTLLRTSELLRNSVLDGSVQLHTGCYVLDGGTIDWHGPISHREED